jgi:hypothetical protein
LNTGDTTIDIHDSETDLEDITSRVLEDSPPVEEEKQVKRIASLDFGRGLAIIGMVFFHVFMRMYDYSYLENMTGGVPDIHIALLIFFGILAFFGTWHAFFLFMSSAINTYVTIRRAYRNRNMLNNMLKQIVTGLVLIFFGWFDTSFGYNGYLGQNILGNSNWSNFTPLYVGIFQSETLHMIGMALILNAIILYFLTRNDGHKKYRRNMLVYFSLSFVVLAVTTILSYVGPVGAEKSVIEYILGVFGQTGTGGATLPTIQNAISKFGAFPAWLLSFTIAGLQPLFPFLITAFTGVMIGLTVAKPDVKRKVTKWGILIGLGVLILGIIYTIINFKFEYRWTIMERTASLSTYLLRLGSQIMVSFGIVRVVEFRGRGAKFANRRVVKFLRFWSVISLTVYIIQIFELFPRWLLTVIFRPFTGISFLEENIIPQGSELLLLFVGVFCVMCYYYLQKLWSKIYYIGTFEWMILKLQQLLFKTEKVRIDADVLMNKVQWINFGEYKSKELSPM